jgi:predicted MFS family arabinose efflux permease
MQLIGASWYAYSISGSAAAGGLLAVFALGPALICSPIGGALAERYDPRRLVIALNGLQAIACGSLAVLTYAGALSLTWLYVLVLANAVPSSLAKPVQVIVAYRTVPPEVRQSAMARTSLVNETSRLVGAVGGGFLVSAIGLATAFALNAASYVFVMVALSRCRLIDDAGEPAPTHAGRNGAGLAAAWSVPIVRTAAIGMAAFFILIAPVEHLMPVVAREHGLTAAAVGVLVGGVSLGAMLGNPICDRTRTTKGRRSLLLAGLTIAAIGLTVLGTTPHQGIIAVDAFAAALIGCGWEFIYVVGQATIVIDAPAAARGRLMGVFYLMASGCTALGALLLGSVIDRLGMSWTFLGVVCIVVLTTMALLSLGTRVGAADRLAA